MNDEEALSQASQPATTLETRDAVGIIVGIVIGAGIFTVPSLVAQSTADRMGVITTSSIAFLAFTFGDCMTKVVPLGGEQNQVTLRER